jgi:flavin-dependent dehydrogenase
VLFAGDAAGFVNAITAEGIYYAMASGDLAATAVIERQAAPTTSGAHYERLWRAELGAELRDATFLQRYLFSNQERVARVLAGAARTRWLTDLILEYTRGERPYTDVRRTVLRRFPLTAIKIAAARFTPKSGRPTRTSAPLLDRASQN